MVVPRETPLNLIHIRNNKIYKGAQEKRVWKDQVWVRVFAKAYEKDSSIRGEIVGTGARKSFIL